MLSPNTRSLYTDVLTPPPGTVFAEAIGTTFSLDPTFMLSVPVHLALLQGKQQDTATDPIATLEAVRRLSSRITVYAQRGRVQVPTVPHILYGLLEPIVIEVAAPRDGAFHPKLWVMRFVEPDDPSKAVLRLMVLSRNVTTDRSWDVALTLEGRPSGRRLADNRSLGELINDLPKHAPRGVDALRSAQATRMADALRRTKWDLPEGFDSVAFHVSGFRAGGWLPPRSKRLAVISPFCSDDALQQLAGTTGSPEALVTRPETFFELTATSRALFARRLALSDAAETEDGEEGAGEDAQVVDARDVLGLHAKVYVFEQGWDTHVALGSANATNAALLGANNVEVLAELVGKRSKVGGVDDLLGSQGLGEVLVEMPDLAEDAEPDADVKAAEDALEQARQTIAKATLRVKCSQTESEDRWKAHLIGRIGPLQGIAAVRCWPISVGDGHAVDTSQLFDQGAADLGTFAPASLTGLIAFEIRAKARDVRVRFVLNLPLEGLPETRDAAVLQTVVRNQDGFLRYLLLLLGDLDPDPAAGGTNGVGSDGEWTWTGANGDALLEELVRAYARDPQRLREVEKVTQQLAQGPNGPNIVPAEFLTTWGVFQRALERRRG